jgi:hypothetical protein
MHFAMSKAARPNQPWACCSVFIPFTASHGHDIFLSDLLRKIIILKCSIYLRMCAVKLTRLFFHVGAEELRKEISCITTIDLPATLVFDYPSIEEMAKAIVTKIPDAETAPTTISKLALGNDKGMICLPAREGGEG